MKKSLIAITALLTLSSAFAREKWTEKQANDWYASQPYLAGANYINRDSINQIEMWNKETFNPKQIDEELGWAKSIGFNTMRVFLHDLVWEENPEGFFERVDKFLEIADKHNIKIMFVFFDSCWNPIAKLGKQPSPRKYIHNSGWLQSPARIRLFDKTQWDILEKYVTDVITRYKNDKRVIVWDLFNEPAQLQGNKFGNESDKVEPVKELLKKVFQWARNANPSQPLTVGVYSRPPFKHKYKSAHGEGEIALTESDVISFHVYNTKISEECVKNLQRYNRPLICTEYMARPISTFNPVLGIFKKHNVGAYNWGFVNGKSQTIYPWNSWEKKYTKDTLPPWFHDIFHADGTPYDKIETDYIKATLAR